MSIFLSYRRADSVDATGRIHDWLEAQLPGEQIIRDIDRFKPGPIPYRQQLERALSSCEIGIVVIGMEWQTPRIEQPDDVHRNELEHLLKRQVPLIPVLLDGAKMPEERTLPISVRGLAGYQAMRIRSEWGFRDDIKFLIDYIKRTLDDERGRKAKQEQLRRAQEDEDEARRAKAGIAPEVWASTRSPAKGIRIGAAYSLGELLRKDESEIVIEKLREMTLDPEREVADYARDMLASASPSPTGADTSGIAEGANEPPVEVRLETPSRPTDVPVTSPRASSPSAAEPAPMLPDVWDASALRGGNNRRLLWMVLGAVASLAALSGIIQAARSGGDVDDPPRDTPTPVPSVLPLPPTADVQTTAKESPADLAPVDALAVFRDPCSSTAVTNEADRVIRRQLCSGFGDAKARAKPCLSAEQLRARNADSPQLKQFLAEQIAAIEDTLPTIAFDARDKFEAEWRHESGCESASCRDSKTTTTTPQPTCPGKVTVTIKAKSAGWIGPKTFFSPPFDLKPKDSKMFTLIRVTFRPAKCPSCSPPTALKLDGETIPLGQPVNVWVGLHDLEAKWPKYAPPPKRINLDKDDYELPEVRCANGSCE